MAKTDSKIKANPEQASLTALKEICGNDTETYQALQYMFLDPRKLDVSMKDAADLAKKAEKEKDFLRARKWYEVAGGLAISQDDPKRASEYYSGAQRVTGEKYLIVDIADKAVAKAQEYYQKYLLPEPGTT